MKCKKCNSLNLEIIKSGPHNKLVCGECLAFQKFISNKDKITFEKIIQNNLKTNNNSNFIKDLLHNTKILNE